jgi:uncharacterized DUF497 family protein
MYICAYIINEVEWDPKKAINNLMKHGIHFSDVEEMFFDERAITEYEDW